MGNYGSFNRMTGFCKTVIPKDLKEKLSELKDNAAECYKFGGEYLGKLCDTILSAKNDDGKWLLPGLHIYTMNTEKCKIGFNDKKYANTMKNELQRVLLEDKQKRLEK